MFVLTVLTCVMFHVQYLESLVGESLFHLGGLLLTRSQTVVVYSLNLAELSLPHLLLLLVHLSFKKWF